MPLNSKRDSREEGYDATINSDLFFGRKGIATSGAQSVNVEFYLSVARVKTIHAIRVKLARRCLYNTSKTS